MGMQKANPEKQVASVRNLLGLHRRILRYSDVGTLIRLGGSETEADKANTPPDAQALSPPGMQFRRKGSQ